MFSLMYLLINSSCTDMLTFMVLLQLVNILLENLAKNDHFNMQFFVWNYWNRNKSKLWFLFYVAADRFVVRDVFLSVLWWIYCYNIPVDREIFMAKNFRRSPSTMKIKPMKYFSRCINRVHLYCQVVIATKIKPGKNLTNEIFYLQKILDLQ